MYIFIEKVRPKALLVFFLIGTAYLGFKVWDLAEAPGYDFKYIWVAGRMWLSGLDPYGPGYAPTAGALITDGHAPEIWAYPPNMLPLAVLLALPELPAAAVAWRIAGALTVVLAAAAIAGATLPARPARSARRVFGERFFLLGFALAGFEAVAISLSTGQTAILMLGASALVLLGLARRLPLLAALGLALLCLKPQIGAAVALALLVLGPEGRRITVAGVLIAAGFALPALLLDPMSPFAWLAQVAAYDDASPANAPAEVTGLRFLAWDLFGIETGSLAPMLVTLGVIGLLAARVRAIGCEPERALAVALAALLALAPLHVYDFTLAAIPVTMLALRGLGGSLRQGWS